MDGKHKYVVADVPRPVTVNEGEAIFSCPSFFQHGQNGL